MADVLKHATIPSRVSVANYALNLSQGLRPTATVKLIIDGEEYQDSAAGDGQFDAFMKAVRNIYTSRLGRPFPTLANYTVNIPPGGRTRCPRAHRNHLELPGHRNQDPRA